MLTTKNYFSETANINWDELPEALAKGNKLVQGASTDNWAAYHSNENIKRVVDAYFIKLEEYLGKNTVVIPEKKLPEASKKKVAKKEIKVSPPKAAQAKILNYKGLKVEIRPVSKTSKRFMVWDVSKVQPFSNDRFDSVEKAEKFISENEMELVKSVESKTKGEYKTKEVEHIDSDVQFIKRYVSMHGKVKTQMQVLSLLHSLQKAIVERRITKDSEYAKDINHMQSQLIKCYEIMGDTIEIKLEPKSLKRYLAIANSEEVFESTKFIKSFISLNGKKGVKDKAQKLYDRMKKAVKNGKLQPTDKYAKKLNEAYLILKEYLDSSKDMLSISKAELNGFDIFEKDELFGEEKAKEVQVISSQDLLKMEFETIGLQGKYRELIGDPSVGFIAMVYGLPKSGKSTMCLDFAQQLAEHHGKVLFCPIEEGFGYTLQEKIDRLGASHPNLYIAEQVPVDLSAFDFVFIDSVSKAGMEISDITALHKKFPRTAFIFIYHSTKEGKFRGGNEHAHEVDVIIEVVNGEVIAKGRFK
ncbi:MAG: DNA repair protein RadA [Sphingobacteriales bacterium]|nr:DNA repair protein RadA [Sphingobacteriales bacterium]